MTDKEKIRATIEKRYNYHKDHADDWAGAEHFWKADEDSELLSFIDSIQEEPVSNDLEYASEKYACRFSNSKYGHDKVKGVFIAGAQWQKKHLWKPSDKQMEAIRIAAEVGTANDSWAMGILRDMYNDLKKLKEK